MSPITKEDLLNEGALRYKLDTFKEELDQYKNKQGELLQEQANILSKKIEELLPLMDFMRVNGLNFTHPTLDFHSPRGAILDYNEAKNDLYIFDVTERWIQVVNLYNQDAKNIPIFVFVQERNLKNAFDGLDHLLNVQEKAFFELNRDIEEREKWIALNK